MSLINDMLRDLDKRRAQHSRQTGDIFAGVQPVIDNSMLRQHKLPQLIFWLAVICIVSIALYLGLRWQIAERRLLLAATKVVVPTVVSNKTAVLSKPVVVEQQSTHSVVSDVEQSEKQGQLSKTPVKLTKNEQAEIAYQQAQQRIDEGDINAGIAMLTHLIATVPEYLDASQLLASQLIKQGQIQQAEDVLRAGLQIAPTHIAFIETLAHLYVDKKQYQNALTILASANPAIEEYPQYYALIAAIHEHLGHYSTAVQLYENLLHLQPANSIWWLGLAISLEGIGAQESAIKAYKHAQLNTSLQPQLRLYINKRLNVLEG